MKTIVATFFALLFLAAEMFAHCQIPCGIYGDETRFNLLMEHSQTISKSITQIKILSEKPSENANQLVRWVNNKEEHAIKIQEIACDYFLAQRVKETQDHYVEELKELHAMIVYAMKCKQSLDESNVEKLNTAIKAFQELYLDPKH